MKRKEEERREEGRREERRKGEKRKGEKRGGEKRREKERREEERKVNGMRVRRIVVDEREKTKNMRQDIFKLTIILYYGSQRIKKDFNLLSPVCARLLYELKLKFTSPNSILSFSISSSN